MITATISNHQEKITLANQTLKSFLSKFWDSRYQANDQQPIFIAENGEITNVILTYQQYQQYQQLQPAKVSLADAFRDYHEPTTADFDFQANRKSQLADSFEFK